MIYCPECGTELRDGVRFCTTCGLPVEQRPVYTGAKRVKTVKTVTYAEPPKKKKKTVFLWLALLLITLASVGVIIYFKFLGPSLIRIDAQSYLDVGFGGYDTEGYITLDQKTGEMRSAALAAIRDRSFRGEIGEKELDRFLETVEYWCDPGEELSNGDTITFGVDYDIKLAKQYNIDMFNVEWTQTVSGLDEYESIDPFEYVSVKFEGMSPNGKASLEAKKVNDKIGTLKYEFDNDRDLSTGDTVTLRCTNDVDLMKDNGYTFVADEKTYTVDSLDEYISSPDELDDEVLARMKNEELKALRKYIKSKTDYSNEYCIGYGSEPEYIGAVVMKAKNMRDSFTKNRVIIVYSVDWTPAVEGAFEPFTSYCPFAFGDVIKYRNGTIDYDYTKVENEFDYKDAIGYHGTSIWGYSDIKNMFTDLVRNKRNDYDWVEDDALKKLVN